MNRGQALQYQQVSGLSYRPILVQRLVQLGRLMTSPAPTLASMSPLPRQDRTKRPRRDWPNPAIAWALPLQCTNKLVSSDTKATAAVISDVLLPHKPQLVQRGHRQRDRRQVHFLRRR